MTRHPFASGLFLSTLLAAAAAAQVYTDQAPPRGSVSQLRPGWAQDGIDPAAARARYLVAPAPVQLVDDNESSHSFLPNWLNWGYNKPPQQQQQQPSNPRSNQQRQRSSNQNNSQQRMQGADADSTPPDPASMQDTQLPGMGGTSVPHARNQGIGNGQDTNPDTTSSGMNSRTNQNRKFSSSNTTTPRVASREPMTPPSDPALGDSAPATTRNSPGRRTAPHITPDELRRELSGTFPSPSAKSESSQSMAAHSAVDADAASSGTASPPSSPNFTKEITSGPVPKSLRSETAQGSGPIAEPSRNAAEVFGNTHRSPSAYSGGGSVHMPFSSVASPTTEKTRGKEAFGEALQVASGGDPNVLASNQTPVLTADIRGPKQILVGRESVYRVHLQNDSDIPAEGIVATVRIPSGAEVVNTTTTQGTVQPSQDPQSAGQLQWHIVRLEHRAGETLEVHIIPRESRPLELGVSWTLAAVGSRAVVEVQEAKLNLEIAGPNEVLFDKPQMFKLTISNPGTGTAENVKIGLLPPGGSQEGASTHGLGDLAAGASQTLEVELTPREAGKMLVKAVATAEGGLNSDAAKEVFCRKPELELDWRGPATKYAGTMATYFVRVRNPGTAPAEDVTVHASLPDGAEFTSASEGQTYDASHREVSWHIGTLGPGDDNYMELKCVLKSAGKNLAKLSASSSAGDLADNKLAETNVIAIADLKLDVADPSGPIAVGAQALYEIHIRNRGASAAKDVDAVALFSDGIEPEQAEGAMYTITDGRVTFRTIEELPAGREVVLRVRAHASQPGTHVFRAEVLCRDLEIKLAAEQTTRFYADDVPPAGDPSQKQSANRSSAFGANVK
ncbi:MAG TPA: CARDB domain-containing protein [Lacipirellulaceae bacterium]|nr:CARDB domain-containing protein [Lacipirellulaceae bacterium]